MKMSAKKIICIAASTLCLFGSTLSAFAGTSPFDITIPDDIFSLREIKDDDEQKFYVTGTYFSQSLPVYCTSRHLYDASISSYEATITPASPRSSASYKKYAPANEYYAMTARSVGTGYHILGRYTP